MSATATITAGPVVDAELADTIILEAMLAAWSDGDDGLAKQIAFELKMIIFFGPDKMTGHRRPNPKERSMRRSGARYQVRKDHGTTARRKEIAASNKLHEDAKPSESGVRGRRKARKHEERSGHPRYRTARS